MTPWWDRLLVTGTDTDVGKTVTTACLAAALAPTRRVRALKPVASGVAPGEEGEDAALIARSAGHPVPPGGVRLQIPCSPHRAAFEEGVRVDLASVLAWIQENIEKDGATLVEGVGGWEVPIGPDWRLSDLASALGWPVLVVARDRVGALNHSLLTVAAIRQRNLFVAGVVLTCSDGGWNFEDLGELLPDVPIARLPTLSGFAVAELRAAGAALLAQLPGRRHSL